MKRILSILLAALLLGGVMSAGFTAAAAPALSAASDLKALLDNGGANITDAQLQTLIKILDALKRTNLFNYQGILKDYGKNLPIAAKATLHKLGLMNYPIWERDIFFNLIFKYLLFGWIWM